VAVSCFVESKSELGGSFFGINAIETFAAHDTNR